MNIALWIIAGVLAAGFLAAGGQKVVLSKSKLVEAGNGWAEDLSPATVRLIGTLEIAAAAGLVLPAVFGVATVLVPVAATGLVVLMVAAATVHLRRGEYPMAAVNATLLVLAAVVMWGRFGS